MSRSSRSVAPMLAAAVGLVGCALEDDFKKATATEAACPAVVPRGPYQSAECLACLRTKCCGDLTTCFGDEDCAKTLDHVLTPVSDAPDSFTTPLICMQTNCDVACNVSFGCEGSGYLPDSSKEVTAVLTDFGAEMRPAAGLDVSLCDPVRGRCFDSVLTSESGTVSLTPIGELGRQLAISDPEFAVPVTDFSHYPPHRITWSEPLLLSGRPITDSLFSSQVVRSLEDGAAGKAYSDQHSHIVFYIHNCLPLRYLGGTFRFPHAGVPGASITFTPPLDTSPEFDVVYRNQSGFSMVDASDYPGSGGVADVPAGRWKAKVDVLIEGDDKRHPMEHDFVVPAGGVGVVHLLPAAR